MCKACGKNFGYVEDIPALGHQHYEYTYKLPTCTEKGLIADTCPVCNKSLGIVGEIDPLGHDEGEWVVTVPSTCTVAGVETRFCTRCGEALETRPAPLAPHVESDWIILKEKDCLIHGFKIKKCVNCGIRMAEEIISAGHTVGAWMVTIEPTWG